MPTYDYLCENCGHAFEKFQSITAGVLRKCPKCKKLDLQRLIGSGAGIIFKGSGFYETDYRSKSYTDGQNKEKPAKEEKKETTPTETKAETKPAKTEKKTNDRSKNKSGETKKSSQ